MRRGAAVTAFVWPDPAGDGEWRRYQGHDYGDLNDAIITVLLHEGVVTGRFSSQLLNDWQRWASGA